MRASAGPPGTPLPGGRKSMWFLSYLREGLSTASNTDIQRAARRRKKADTEDENASTQLPLSSHLFIKTSTGGNTCAHASLRKPMHIRLSASAVQSMRPVREKVWLGLGINGQPITSSDRSPSDTHQHGCTNTQASASVSREKEGDFHGNVICIISSGVAQLIRYESEGL